MTNKEFFKELRKVIKEEINLALKEKNAETTEKDFNKQVNNFQKMQSEIKNNSTVKKENPTLLDILNETKDSMLSNEWKTVNFTSDDARGFANKLGYGDMMRPNASTIPTVDINGAPVLNLDSNTANALTKNYSELMKAIKDKKK